MLDLASAQAQQAILPGVDRSITDIKIAAVTPTFFWDRRDDPINSRKGTFNSVSFDQSAPFLGSDVSNRKLLMQQFLFVPLGRTIYLSFFYTRQNGAISSFAGLDQYTELLSSPIFGIPLVLPWRLKPGNSARYFLSFCSWTGTTSTSAATPSRFQ